MMNKIEKAIAEAIHEQVVDLVPDYESNMEILTPYEAVDFFGGEVSYSTLMRACRCGNIPHFKIGSRVYFRKIKLMEWIEAQERLNK